jgi:hypothetical protein
VPVERVERGRELRIDLQRVFELDDGFVVFPLGLVLIGEALSRVRIPMAVSHGRVTLTTHSALSCLFDYGALDAFLRKERWTHL